MKMNTTSTTKTADHLRYQAEVKCSNAFEAYPYVWSPARVYVRGYDHDGLRQYEETIGFCNKNRMSSLASRGGRRWAYAMRKAALLQATGGDPSPDDLQQLVEIPLEKAAVTRETLQKLLKANGCHYVAVSDWRHNELSIFRDSDETCVFREADGGSNASWGAVRHGLGHVRTGSGWHFAILKAVKAMEEFTRSNAAA